MECIASKKVDKIYCAPGNGGISQIAECVDISAMEFDKLADFAEKNEVDLTIIGMDDPLVGGMLMFLKKEVSVYSDHAKTLLSLRALRVFQKIL